MVIIYDDGHHFDLLLVSRGASGGHQKASCEPSVHPQHAAGCPVAPWGEFWSGGRASPPPLARPTAPPQTPPQQLHLNSIIIHYTNISYHNQIIQYHLPTHTPFTPFGGRRITPYSKVSFNMSFPNRRFGVPKS